MLPGIQYDVVEFVMSRWQASGGFGFVPSLPASVEDTYHAIRILETIRPLSEAEVNGIKRHPKLKDFLGRQEDKDAWSLGTASQYLHLCQFCGCEQETSWLHRFLETRIKGALSLGSRYYLARIAREFPGVSPSGGTGTFPSGEGDKWRTAEDLLMLLYIHQGAAGPLRATRDDLVQWLQACQTPDGGFGGRPGTTSFIENTHWCIEALSLLETAPLFPDRAVDFILACKKRGGGFARKSGGAPFLYATWHAVAGLALLRPATGLAGSPEPSEEGGA